MVKHYFKTAWRTIWKNKQVSFIHIAGLSIGMTAAIFIFLWVRNEMSFDSYHPQANNIYRITDTLHIDKQTTWVWQTSPLPLAEAARRELPAVKNTGVIQPVQMVFNVNGQLFNEKECAYVDKGWFQLFHYDFIAGNPEALFQNPFSILLTQSVAKKYFGNGNPVGQIIRIDTMNYTVRAVVKDNPANSSFQYQAMIPLAAHLSNTEQKKTDESWSNFNYVAFLLLHRHTDVDAVTKQLEGIMGKNRKENNASMGLEPLKSIHFESGLQFSLLRHGNKKTVYIFTVLGFLLILIACINYVNLTTARASLRAKEIGVRKVVGAQRRHLLGQFVMESIIISFISLVLTVFLINLLLPYFNRLTSEHFVLSLTSSSILEILLSTLVLVVLLNSIYPALLLSSFKPLRVFRGISVLKIRDAGFRKVLVTLQFTVSSLLIIGTLVIFSQLRFIQRSTAGYNKSQIFSLQVPISYFINDRKEIPSLINSFKNELRQQSSVAGITAANSPLFDIKSLSSGNARWGNDSAVITVSRLAVDAAFQNVFHLQIEAGRWFMPDRNVNNHSVILNETAVRQYNMHGQLIGQPFTFQGKTGKIIGIVKDFHYHSFHDKIGPLIIFDDPSWYRYIFIKAEPGKIPQALAAAGGAWKKIFSAGPFDYTFLDKTFDNLYKSDLLTSKLILIFSCLAIFISCLGLLGLTAFAAAQRTKEIGIRKVLGASVKDIISLLSRDFMWLVGIAFIVASPVAWWIMNKWLQNFAYRIHIGAWIFMGAGIILFFIALVTTGYYAMRAGMRNPVRNLRTE